MSPLTMSSRRVPLVFKLTKSDRILCLYSVDMDPISFRTAVSTDLARLRMRSLGAPESIARASYMSSTHLSLIESPVDALIPSDLAVRAILEEVPVGVVPPFETREALREARRDF